MLIQIVDGWWCDPWSVTVVKKIDENSCAVWTTGQSALEGFVLEYSAEEVADAVNDARNDEDGDSEDE